MEKRDKMFTGKCILIPGAYIITYGSINSCNMQHKFDIYKAQTLREAYFNCQTY